MSGRVPRCPAPRDLMAGASALSSARWLTPCRARPEGPEQQQEAWSCLQEFAVQEGKASLGTGSSAVGVRGSDDRRARGPSPPAPDAVPSIATSSLPNARSDIPPGDGSGHVGPEGGVLAPDPCMRARAGAPSTAAHFPTGKEDCDSHARAGLPGAGRLSSSSFCEVNNESWLWPRAPFGALFAEQNPEQGPQTPFLSPEAGVFSEDLKQRAFTQPSSPEELLTIPSPATDVSDKAFWIVSTSSLFTVSFIRHTFKGRLCLGTVLGAGHKGTERDAPPASWRYNP